MSTAAASDTDLFTRYAPPSDRGTLPPFAELLLDLRELAYHSPPDAFPGQAFTRIARLIPHQSAFWAAGRPPVEAPIPHFIHLHRLPEAMTADWLAIRAKHDPVTRILYHHAGRAMIFDTQAEPFLPAFRTFFGKYGVRQILSIYLRDPDLQLFWALSLYRHVGAADFSELERQWLENLAAHFVVAHRENALTTLLREDCRHQAATAVADPGATLHLARPNFIALLRSEWPAWQGPDLNSEARTWLANEAGHQPYLGRHIALTARRSRDLWLLSARPLLPSDQLSVREREIARRFASGSDHKNIGRQLAIAPTTVRNHLANIYRKLGISNKGELATCLLAAGDLNLRSTNGPGS